MQLAFFALEVTCTAMFLLWNFDGRIIFMLFFSEPLRPVRPAVPCSVCRAHRKLVSHKTMIINQYSSPRKIGGLDFCFLETPNFYNKPPWTCPAVFESRGKESFQSPGGFSGRLSEGLAPRRKTEWLP